VRCRAEADCRVSVRLRVRVFVCDRVTNIWITFPEKHVTRAASSFGAALYQRRDATKVGSPFAVQHPSVRKA
jgi:hypothetical protein